MEIQRKFPMGFRVPQRSKTWLMISSKNCIISPNTLEFQSHRASAVNFGRTKSTKPTVLTATSSTRLFCLVVFLLIFLGVMVPRISPKSTVYAYVHFLHPRIANIRKPSIERWLKLAIEWPLKKHEQKITCNNPLRFETTKCSKQRVEQSSARTLFPKCVHKLGSPRFFLEAVFLNNGYCRSCSESSSGSCSFFKWFSFFPIHEMSVVAR